MKTADTTEKFHIAHESTHLRKPIFEGYNDYEQPSIWVSFFTYFSYAILSVYGHIYDLLVKLKVKEDVLNEIEKGNEGFVPLITDFGDFFKKNMYRRLSDCYNRPVTNVPGGRVDVLHREWDDHIWSYTVKKSFRNCLNLGSYNYLGFSQNEGPCADFAVVAIKKYGIATASPAIELGTQDITLDCEQRIARFVGKEAAMVIGMGFATNSTILPALVDKDCIILSDSLNHASLVFGARISGANIQVFKHNNMENLEYLLQRMIASGQPRTHKPWKKILIVVEGIYSMEGVLANLPALVRLKKKYKAYLYLDEAHSIGSIGKSGRGVCEYWGIDTMDVDIMMGTFTKSFGASGGYIAADKEIIDHLRINAHSYVYAPSMSAPICAQIIKTVDIISGADGTEEGRKRLLQLARNTRYFRRKCIEMGFIIYGSDDSPVVPLLIYHPAKLAAFSRMMLLRNIAVVVVGYPATEVISSRARFCLSAAHSRSELNEALKALDVIGDYLSIKYSRQPHVIGKFTAEEENNDELKSLY